MSSKPRAVVLLSGGLDSATTLALAREAGFECHALTVRYGQRHAVEIEAARRVARAMGVARHVELEIDLRAFGGSALTSEGPVPKDRTELAMTAGHPGHLCSGTQHGVSVTRTRLGGNAGGVRHLDRRQLR